MEEIIIIKWMPHTIKEVDLWKLSKEDFTNTINSPQYYNLDKWELIISKERYLDLLCIEKNLSNLEWHWVDNWDGYYEVPKANRETLEKIIDNYTNKRRIIIN